MIDYDKLFSKYEFRRDKFGDLCMHLGCPGSVWLQVYSTMDDFKLVINLELDNEQRFDLQFKSNQEIENFINSFVKLL